MHVGFIFFPSSVSTRQSSLSSLSPLSPICISAKGYSHETKPHRRSALRMRNKKKPSMSNDTWVNNDSSTSASAESKNAAFPTSSPGTVPNPNAFHQEACSWNLVESMIAEIAKQIKEQNIQFDAIMGVTRGGMIPAILFAEMFEVRNILAATVIFYTDDGSRFYGLQEPRFLYFPEDLLVTGMRILVVDDVWDTGRTVRAVRDRVSRAGGIPYVCTLHYKPNKSDFSNEKPDFYSQLTDDWIIYPWERLSPSFQQAQNGK